MHILDETIRAALAAGVTRHAWCWRVTRRDGVAAGFTDHDRDLVFDGTTFQASSGFGAVEAEAECGLAAGQGAVAGALDSTVLSEADIEAGLWSGARVETWRVDWTDPAHRVRTGVHTLGEIRRRDGVFEAELDGPGRALDRITGRVFARRCDAVLGDARCGVEAGHPDFAAGCDRRFATCRDRFSNTLNFRGFPYLVGNDVLQASPASEPVRDGGSRGLGA